MGALEEIRARLQSLPEKEKAAIVADVTEGTKHMIFVPNPGPQTQGYISPADVVLFGGEPAGGKTALGIGLALNEHHRSLLIRKSFADLDGLLDTTEKLVGSERNLTRGSRPKYYKPGGGVIHFAGLPSDGGIGTHQGVDHDYIYIDEAAQIPEKSVRLLLGWLRTDRPGQRCRVVMGSNPPLDPVGDWLIDFFAPWLNPTYPYPAKPGELRYFLPGEDDKDYECEKNDTTTIAGLLVRAQSRTFIPSKLADNPYYDKEEYAKTLAALPATERAILMSGNFMLARKDQPSQVCPTAWVKAAQARWRVLPPAGVPMCAIGVDCSGGGDDPMVASVRHDGWFAPLHEVPGKDIPMHRLGAHQAGIVTSLRKHDATMVIDMGGGYGGPVYEKLADNFELRDLVPYKGAEGTALRTHDKKLGFVNTRSAAYWQFREALDPSQDGGSPIELPDDPVMVSDLCAPTFEITSRGIKVEPKEDVCGRLNRSTDRGDAVVMAWFAGARNVVRRDVNSAEDGVYLRPSQRNSRRAGVNHGPRRPNGMGRRL